MKKIILFILLFCATKSFAQFPINAAQGTQTTTVLTRGISASDSGYWYRTAFADTTALNRGRIDEIAGVVARTSDNSLWLRNNTATRWIQLSGGSGSVNIYNSDGTQTGNRIVTGGGYTLAFDAQSSIRLQPSGSNRTSLLYMDIDSIRLEPPFGILTIDSLASGASTDSVLVWTQATGRVKKRSYSSFTPTWQQTLTAGSTLTTDNTIAGGGNSILWNGFNDFEVLSSGAQLFKADFGGYSAQVGITQGLSVTIGTYDVGIPGHNSALEIYADSIGASPYSGRYAIDTLNNLSNQNTLLGRVNNISAPNGNGHGNIGYVTLGSGLSLSSGVLNTSGTVATPISSLTAATGTNSINNADYSQTWGWNSLTGVGLSLSSSSTAASAFSVGQNLLSLSLSGAHANSTVTSTTLAINNSHTGTSPTNQGISLVVSGGLNNLGIKSALNSTGNNISAQFEAIGGTTNYAIIVPASSGSVGIGTSTPTEILHVVGNIKGTNYIELTDVSAPSTPSSGFGRIYVRADSLRFKNDGGTEFTMGTGGGSSTSPAGNFGNLQINRNGAFATPASDSLDWESATGLSITGNLSASVQTTTPLIYGSTSANGDIEIKGTSSATKTTSYVNLQSDGGNVGIGTASPITKLDVSGYNTTNSQLAVGSLEMQPYDQSNGWLSQNIYYSSGFKYRANGAGGLFYFLGTEGQFRFAASGTAGGDPGINSIAQFKVNADGTVVIGGTASASAGTYTGATLLANSSKVGIGQNVYVGDITSTPSAYLHLKAGTATASTAPLKFTTGTLNTTAEAGAMEYSTPNFYVTAGDAVRYTLAKTLTATATLDFGNTAAGVAADLTVTVTGAADGDAVYVGAPNGSVSATDNVAYWGWVSAANTVTVRFNNNNLVTAVNPASGTFRVVVTKY